MNQKEEYMKTKNTSKNTKIIKFLLLGTNILLLSCNGPTPVSTANPDQTNSPASGSPVSNRENKGVVSTFSGKDSGNIDGTKQDARFYGPSGIVIDKSGTMFIADSNNHRIRKITPEGNVSTLAGKEPGSKNGNGTNASFYSPAGIALDSSGNIFVADSNNHSIRKITPGGDVSRIAGSDPGFSDGKGQQAKFYNPMGVALDKTGNIFVSDSSNNRVRKITPDGTVTTLAGSGEPGDSDGSGTSVSFYKPLGLAIDNNGTIFIADTNNNRIRKLEPNGKVTTIAGSDSGNKDGNGTNAFFYKPAGITVDNSGNIYVTDIGNQSVKKIDTSGNVKTLAGSSISGNNDGTGTAAQFTFYKPNSLDANMPGIAIDSNNTLFVSDYFNNSIRKIE